jgi:hypothetical protein
MSSLTTSHQILDKHTIVDIFCSKRTSKYISRLRFHLQSEIALRNPFSQNKSTILFISDGTNSIENLFLKDDTLWSCLQKIIQRIKY